MSLRLTERSCPPRATYQLVVLVLLQSTVYAILVPIIFTVSAAIEVELRLPGLDLIDHCERASENESRRVRERDMFGERRTRPAFSPLAIAPLVFFCLWLPVILDVLLLVTTLVLRLVVDLRFASLARHETVECCC